MSKSGVGIVIIVLAAVMSSVALGRGGGGGHGGGGHGGGGHGGGGHGGGGHGGGHYGGHFGGGHFAGHRGGARVAVSHGSFHNHSFGRHGGMNFGTVRNAQVRSATIRSAMNSLSHTGGLRNGRLLSNPAARGQIAAAAALAGWHGGHFANGWWRHGNGFFGWVGPLFWPFAYYDIYDYTIWGDYGLWYYGYPDIYAGIFGPYGYDDLNGYLSQAPYQRQPRASWLAQMCGDDSRDIAGLPIDQIEQAVQPNEAQRAAFDDLGNASVKAARSIRAACPTQVVLTAPGRLAAMEQRIEAAISAVAIVRPPLERVYSLLDDEQKARFNALADQRARATANNPKGSVGESCGAAQSATFEWPAGEIEARLHPNDAQRAGLKALQDASSKAADMLKAACQPDDPATPTARLAAIGSRLDTMLEAVKLVRTALEDFYATLSDEQKAQFEAIGQKRMLRGA